MRALPISAAVIWLAFTDRRTGWRRLTPVLALTGLVKSFDAIIGAASGTASQVLGGAAAAIIHLGSAWLLHRREPGWHRQSQIGRLRTRDS